MINKSVFSRLKGRMLRIPDTDGIDGIFAKNLRVERFNMSQNAFSEALGISKKTVEAWEVGRNNPDSATKKLLYLLSIKPELMKELYSFDDENTFKVFNGFFTEPQFDREELHVLVSSKPSNSIPVKERYGYVVSSGN